MGQINSQNLPSNEFLPKEYHFVSQQIHSAFGEIKVYQQLQLQNYSAYKTVKQIDEKFITKIKKYHNTNTSDFLVKLLCYETQDFKEICSNYTRVSLLFEFFPQTLRSEFDIRTIHHENFHENELFNIFLSIITGLNELKSMGFEYSDLNPNNILLSRSGVCKLTPIDDLTGMSGFAKILSGYSKDKTYASPELLKKKTIENEELDSEKSNVFSLGIILLEAANLEKNNENTSKLSEKSIEKNINKEKDLIGKIMNSNINEGFKGVLLRMLDEQPENRPNYGELLGEMADFKDNFLGIKLYCYSSRERLEENKNFSISMDEKEEIVGDAGFHGLVGKEFERVENRKMTNNLLNLHEISNIGEASAKELSKENPDFQIFRVHAEKIFSETMHIAEEIQRKYLRLTNKKEIEIDLEENEQPNFLQNSMILTQIRKETYSPKASLLLKKVDSSTSLGKDYHYFPRTTNIMTPYNRKETLDDLSRNKSHIKNFDYSAAIDESPVKIEKKKMKSFNNTPVKNPYLHHSTGKKYYTPKRDPSEKIKLTSTASPIKKSMFKLRPVTPIYEGLYWEALKKKFGNNMNSAY